MNKLTKLALAAGTLAASYFAFDAYSRKTFFRSGAATAANSLLKVTVKKPSMDEERARLEEVKLHGENFNQFPTFLTSQYSNIDVFDDGNDELTASMTTYRIRPVTMADGKPRILSNSELGTVILYIHGGGYVSSMLASYMPFLEKLTQKTKAVVYAPDYQVAPFATVSDVFPKITELYKQIRKANPDKRIVIAGDSAGGGMALGLMLDWAKKSITLPNSAILLSPWVDVTMSHEESTHYDELDTMIGRNALIVDGQYWAGDVSTTDYRVSPANGDLSTLKELDQVTLFAGTRELFYPDIVDFAASLTEANVQTRLHIGE